MARDEFRVDLTADNEISDEALQAAKDLDQIPERIETRLTVDSGRATRDVEDLLAKVDRLSAEPANLLLTSNAARITNEIADVVMRLDQLDSQSIEFQVRAEQVNGLYGDLERVQAKAKELNGTPIQLDTGPAVRGVTGLSDSARGANNALSSMVGGTVGEVAGLVGVAGPAGAALDQMASAAIDAALGGEKLGSALLTLGRVVGPVALLAGAVQVVSGLMAESAAEAAAANDRVERFGKAMESSADDAVGLTDALRDSITELRTFDASASTFGGLVSQYLGDIGAQLPLVGGLFRDAGTDIIAIADKAGLSIYDLSKAIEEGGVSGGDFTRELLAAADAGRISTSEYDALAGAVSKYGEATRDAQAVAKLFNVDQAEANSILQETIAQAAPLEQYADLWRTLFADLADGSIDAQATADVINQLAESLGLTREEVIALGREGLAEQMEADRDAAIEATEARRDFNDAVRDSRDAFGAAEAASAGFASAMRQINESSSLDFSLTAADTVRSFDEMKAGLDALVEAGVDWSNVDLSPDSVGELRGASDELLSVTDAIAGMRDAIGTELQDAFDTGGIDAYTSKAQFFRDEILAQYPAKFRELGASQAEADQQTQALLDDLELLPSDVAVQVRLTRMEEARAALDSFGSVISQLPLSKQVDINARIAQGDIEGALNLLNTELINRGFDPIVLATDVNTVGVIDAVDDARAAAAATPAVLDVEGNVRPATADIERVERAPHETTIDADADTALATNALLAFISRPRTTIVYVGTSGIPQVDGQLNLAARDRTATIDARIGSVPSAQSIANRIGPVRVPVDAYVRSTPRITGIRD